MHLKVQREKLLMRGISRRDPFKMVQNLRVRRTDKRIRLPFTLKWKNEPYSCLSVLNMLLREKLACIFYL